MFSVVNAGNIREFVMELSANAAMMWDFETYSSDTFLKDYCNRYYGISNGEEVAKLYADYYHAYWQPKKPELAGFSRQFVFQDLRYKRAISTLANGFGKNELNPFKDNPGEQLPGRTFRIVPEDNQANNQVEAVANGTKAAWERFRLVMDSAVAMQQKLPPEQAVFFNDNLLAPVSFMYYLNQGLYSLSKAYISAENGTRKMLVANALEAVQYARQSLLSTQHGVFDKWYASDRIFGMDGMVHSVQQLNDKLNR
jgi:hypothetical protein